ncbi:leucine-rich repeats and immunoglobulin-like domains protein 3 isoform X2 [Octopus vulgaris]|uniref:Leucine-rich repeats and immunoglobulin-like domains protein 3 isoform X2 n=1 Tax=Octopus vulgaris TaxID=6645 RepID=A0AA36FA06_OCTVU|nr:leucine-rich repeats and immunoglobulin-like domains protein 3 isoform X2 [Octopus vulgaris]
MVYREEGGDVGWYEEWSDVFKNILWSDEVVFHIGGFVNHHNCYYWAGEDPRITSEKIQNRPKTGSSANAKGSEMLKNNTTKSKKTPSSMSTPYVARTAHNQCPSKCNCLGSFVDCSKQGFQHVPPDLPSWVEFLDLQSNIIMDIQPNDFKGFVKLKKLDISSNKITHINESVFSHLPNLKELKLSYNNLAEMPYFGKNYSLEQLHLHHNWIRSIDSRVLNGLPKLRMLDLNFNHIYNITTGTFHAGLNLHQLYLNNNRVRRVEKYSFDNLTSLELLKMNKNKLDHLPEFLFEKLTKLKCLEMSRNKFTVIESLSFRGLDNLQILKLKRNFISKLKDGSFFGLGKIQNLQLNHNNISTISKGWLYGLKTLKQLSLTHNNIKSVELDGWESCRLLRKLDLSHNQLSSITVNSFANLAALKSLYLGHNHISHIERGAFKDLSNLEIFQLNHNEISSAVEDIDGAFAGLHRLTQLDLNGNKIKSLAKRSFIGLQNLEHLFLLENHIASILENAFEPLHLLKELQFNTSNLLCDCHLAWLPKWLYENKFEDSVTAICAHPHSSKGKSIFAVKPEEFDCTDFPKPVITSQPMSQKALKGENLTLNCSAVSSGFYDTKFQWKKDSMILTDPKMFNFTSMEGKLVHLTTLLHLENVQDETAGKYQCIISNHFGSAYSTKANISVHVYPSFTKKPEDVTVKSGSIARLECAASGQPPPQIAWKKDGGNDFPAAHERRMLVMPSDDVFFIVKVKSSDEGTYSCTATNEAGTAAVNATLKVLEIPSFTRPMIPQKVIRLGETTVLECMASGSPKPKLTWLKDNILLRPTRRHHFTASDQLLVIMDTVTSDAGIYTCELSNTLGLERGTTKLIVSSSRNLDPAAYSDNGLENSSTTTGIIIIAVICSVVGTSLVWVIIIYQTRKRPEEYSATPTGNSISSLHCPNSESDTLKSSRSTSSTHTGGNSAEHSTNHSTMQTFHPQTSCPDSLVDSDCPPDSVERIHRFPALPGTPPASLRRAYLRVGPESLSADRYHGSQPPGTSWETDQVMPQVQCKSPSSNYLHNRPSSSPLPSCLDKTDSNTSLYINPPSPFYE